MRNLQTVITGNIDELKETKSYLSTEHQVVAVEAWGELGKPKTKKNELPILFRLAKQDLPAFKEAKQAFHAAKKDGILIRNAFSYFLWFYKQKRSKK